MDNSSAEEIFLKEALREIVAHECDERLEVHTLHSPKDAEAAAKTLSCMEFAIFDITIPGSLESARTLRILHPDTEILLIADMRVSPMQYLHPSIKASALLLRPRNKEWKGVLWDFFEALMSKNQTKASQDVLWIENREGKFRVPFHQIHYLEAREKKIFVCTGVEEFAMSGTLDRIFEQLPPEFLRCHRSYIVNAAHIRQWRTSDMMLYLSDNLRIPVSRSYKEVIKRKINERTTI